jgi:sulfate permease, SulP family
MQSELRIAMKERREAMFNIESPRGAAVNTIDASALESLEVINHRLKDGGITFHLSAVKGPVMDCRKRSHFLEELTGKAHLTQYDAVSSINPDLARHTLEAQRCSDPQLEAEKEASTGM